MPDAREYLRLAIDRASFDKSMTDRVREYLRLISDRSSPNKINLTLTFLDENSYKIQQLWLAMSHDEKTLADALIESVVGVEDREFEKMLADTLNHGQGND